MNHHVRDTVVTTLLFTVVAMSVAITGHASTPNNRDSSTTGGEGDSERIAIVGGNASTSASRGIAVPNASGLVTPYEPPTCDYYKWKTTNVQTVSDVIDIVIDAEGNEIEEPRVVNEERWYVSSEIATDGSYEYYEVAADSIIPNSDLADQFDNPVPAPPGGWNDPWADAFNDLAAIFRPLEDLTRRFRIRCALPPSAYPQGELLDGETFDPTNPVDGGRYDGQFVDIDPNDALWGLDARFTQLFADFDLEVPQVVAPDVVDEWGGLVVRSPAWLGIAPRAWQLQSDSADHLGFRLSLIAQPIALDHRIVFTPRDAEDSALAGVTLLDCVGEDIERFATNGRVLPAAPSDLAEFDDPGRTGPCAWTPPARGCVSITPVITYSVYRTVNGTGELYQTHQETGDTTSLYVGELRAVNVNDADRPRVPDIPNCN